MSNLSCHDDKKIRRGRAFILLWLRIRCRYGKATFQTHKEPEICLEENIIKIQQIWKIKNKHRVGSLKKTRAGTATCAANFDIGSTKRDFRK